jgi:hypothetical protein
LKPFHATTEPETKLEPVTVNVKSGPPRVAVVGEIAVIVGAGGGDVGALTPQLASRHMKRHFRLAISR